jgi:hypothetical protein
LVVASATSIMVPVTAFTPNATHKYGNTRPKGFNRRGGPETQHNQAEHGGASGYDSHPDGVEDENRRESPNRWGFPNPLAELRLFEEDQKLLHTRFPALLDLLHSRRAVLLSTTTRRARPRPLR